MSFENTPDRWKSLLFRPDAQTHKYDRGHVVVLAGEMVGASRLAAYTARRIGAGLVTIACTEAQRLLFAGDLPGNIVSVYDTEHRFTAHLTDKRKNTFVLGPGDAATSDMRSLILNTLAMGSEKNVVLDARALTLFEGNVEELLDAVHENCVLTPHKGEFARIFPDLVDTSDALLALAAAKRAGCTIVLKGHTTTIASPEGVLVENLHTSAWLATAGSGDVLAGMIAGLMAQGMPAFQAAQAAVWLHGDAAQRSGGAGLIAEDIPDILPECLQDLFEDQ